MGYYENVPLILLGFQYLRSHFTIYVAVLIVDDDSRLPKSDFLRFLKTFQDSKHATSYKRLTHQ
jgi:hypothetical protein